MRGTHQASMVLLVSAALSVLSLRGQTLGELTGEVTDSSGGVILGATITATNEGTNVSRQAVTNSAGTYSFPAMQPGIYRLRVEMAGFQSMERRGVELQVQQVARIDFRMEVGQATQTVNVEALAPLLTTENATTGTVIENKRILDLPLNGRDFLQLVALSPNVTYGTGASSEQAALEGNARASQQISVSGARTEFNHYTLDGIENTDDNENEYIFLPSIDALEEFKVQTGVYPAEFGRNVSQINVSTKSGSNGYHGALFEFFRNSKMDANDFGFTAVAPIKNPLVRNQYGYTLGGPVVIPKVFNGRNRLFFMTNYEALRLRTGIHSIASVPNAALRSGNFSGISQVLFDPSTRVQNGTTITAVPFANNIIPTSELNAKAVTLLQYYPMPNVAGAGLSNNYQILLPETQNQDQFTVRIDFAESANSNWFGRYTWDSESGITPATFPNQGITGLTDANQAMISNTRVLSPTIVNEFRFGYNRFLNDVIQQGANVTNAVGQVGLVGVATPTPAIYGVPVIGITGFSGFGDNSQGPSLTNLNIFQWTDNVSIHRGTHSMRFGAEVRRDQFGQRGNTRIGEGFVQFFGSGNPEPTNKRCKHRLRHGGLSARGRFRNSVPGSLGLAIAQLRGTIQAYYFDDSWKIRPNVTLSLGLRYELTPPYTDKGNGILNVELPSLFDPNQPPVLIRPGNLSNFYQGMPIVFASNVLVATTNQFGNALVQTDYKNFAPRIGLAYSLTPTWTIRTGFGLFYANDAGNASYDLARNLEVRLTANANSNFPATQTLNEPFTTLTYNNQGVPVVSTPLPLAHCYCLVTPYVTQYLFNVQHQLSQNSVLEFGYSGNEGHHLDRYYGANFPLPGPGNVQTRRPYPSLANIFYLESGINSVYNAAMVKLTERLSRGFTALLSYTFSRSIDDASAVRSHAGDPNSENDQNPYDMAAERGPSIFNVPHRLVVSLLWAPPFGKGKSFLANRASKAILGDWQLGSIVTVSSGLPFTVTSGVDQANIGGNSTQRPSYSGQPLDAPAGQSLQQWFNPAAFVLPALYTFGNVGRDTMRGPDLFDWDFSAMKNIPMPVENHILQFRFEVFNLPNHPNFSIPASTLTGAGFGTITSTAINMRQIQLSLKYLF